MSLPDFQPRYLDLEDQDGILVVSFRLTHLHDEENIEQLGQELVTLVEQFNVRRMVLKTDNVQQATSSVLGKMIKLHRLLHRLDGQFLVSGPQGVFRETLETSRLITYFKVFDSLDEALADLQAEQK